MSDERAIAKEVLLKAPLEDVWHAWTTSEGAVSFFAPDADIQLQPGGAYELYFDLKQPAGLRGSEGCRVLVFIPYSMLSFTWNNPPHFKEIRDSFTTVVLFFERKSDNLTRLALRHEGWPVGDLWDSAFAYFENAWDIVLSRLRRSLEEGPLDWEKI